MSLIVPRIPKFCRLNLSTILACDNKSELDVLSAFYMLLERGSAAFASATTTWSSEFEARTWIGNEMGMSAVIRTCLFRNAKDELLVEFTRMSGDRGLEYQFAFAASGDEAFRRQPRHFEHHPMLTEKKVETEDFFYGCKWHCDSSVKETMQWLIQLASDQVVRQQMKKEGVGHIAEVYALRASDQQQPGAWAASVAAEILSN